MEFRLFFALTALAVYLVMRAAGSRLFRRKKSLPVHGQPVRYESAGLLLLIPVSLAYSLAAPEIWQALDKGMEFLAAAWGRGAGDRLVDLYLVSRFFRLFYPALAVLTLLFALGVAADARRYTSLYRWYRFYRHIWLWPLVGSWVIFGLLDRLNTLEAALIAQAVSLNMALYFTGIYAVYGFLLIMYACRRKGLPVWVPAAVLITLLVISGPLFVLPCVILAGIGLSDIWMGYRVKFRLKNPKT